MAGAALSLALPLTVHAAVGDPLPVGSPLARDIHYQFAIYYLHRPAQPPLNTLRNELKQTAHAPMLVDGPKLPLKEALIHAEYNTQVQSSYAPPSLEMLHYFGRGVSRDQALALQQSQQALVLDFAHPASLSPAAYRISLQLTEQLARSADALIWDEETRETFTPNEWHKRRLEGWDRGTPDVLKQVVVHAYQGDKLVRAISLGMGKFGLPDLVVEDFSWSLDRPMGNLLNLLAQAMVEGATIGPKGNVDLELRSIKHAAVRQSQLSTLKPNAAAQAPLVLVEARRDEGDPRNRLAEIRFDRVAGPDRYARQEALLDALFGSQDSIARVKHNDQLLDASKAAKAKLPALSALFNKGMQPGEYLLVKAPFTTSSGGNEWMWVEVTAWKGDEISGLLKNEPTQVPALHGGQMVKVSQRDIFDYIHNYADGHSDGNETGKIIQRMQKSAAE